MFEEQIAKGVEYLDQDLGPTWVEDIETRILDLESECNCVLGQLFGDFNNAVHCPSRNDEECGFVIFLGNEENYAQLTLEWREKIAQLKAERIK